MAAGDVKVYDADQCIVSFASIDIQGWAEDDFCTIVNESDGFTDVVGVDGEVTRSKTNDRRATVDVSTMQSSSANAKLSALHNLDLNTPGGAGISDFYFEDMGGETVIKGDRAWIMKSPDATYSRGPNERVWRIRIASVDRNDGGN